MAWIWIGIARLSPPPKQPKAQLFFQITLTNTNKNKGNTQLMLNAADQMPIMTTVQPSWQIFALRLIVQIKAMA